MTKAYYNGYCINYTSKNIQDRNKLINFMKNVVIDYDNYFKKNIVLSKKGENNDESTQYIENIDEELLKISKELYSKINAYVKNEKDLYASSLYLESFLYSIDYRDKDKDVFIANKVVANEKNTYIGLGALYFTNIEEYKDFLINMDENTKTRIRDYFSNEYQITIFEKILKKFSNLVNDTYPEVITEIRKYSPEIKKYLIETKKDYNTTNSNYTIFDNNKTDTLFKEFLMEVEPSGKWLKDYEKLKKNNCIQFIEYSPDIDKKTGFYNNKYIIIISENNCNDLIRLAHEFAHYISKKKDYDFNNLLEFPSIYYELKAQEFLIKKGIAEEELTNIRKKRDEKLNKELNYTTNIYNMISYLKDNKTIKNYPKLVSKNKEELKTYIDNKMTRLVNNPESIYKKTTYPTGKYLADKMLKMENSEEIMKSVTENLQDYDITSILNIIDKEKTI